jgi:hypothetical protein
MVLGALGAPAPTPPLGRQAEVDVALLFAIFADKLAWHRIAQPVITHRIAQPRYKLVGHRGG